jgi:tape measure domain-containing protein
MPTLGVMFKLFDGYSTTVTKINKKTDEAANKMLKASGLTDKFNNKLAATGASAGSASSGLKKFISAAALVTGTIKAMNIADEFTNTSARLNLINDGLQTQAELQEKIFAAADRSKGSYTDMAGAISKMGILAKEQFKSNDELIGFTELVQKSFKVGGASASEQSSALLQLTQAMSAGKLQGDEFRSIMENAPMIADAIAKYTGKSKGELKKLSSEGLITSDIIKNAMFAASDNINSKFGTMPMTFTDIWNKIKNGGLKAFSSIMEKVNSLINTDGFQQFANNVTLGFNLISQAANWLFDVIVNGWDTIGPILGIIGGAILLTIIANLWGTVAAILAQGVAWMAAYWPLLLVIGVIAIAISAARQLGATWEDISGFIGGLLGIFAVNFYNHFVKLWNIVAAFINFFGNVFKHPIASIKALFYDMASTIIGYIAKIAQGIEDLLNKIPWLKVNITGGLDNLESKLKKASATVKSEADLKTYVKSKEFMDFSAGYNKGSKIGKDISNNIGKSLGSLTNSLTKDKTNGYDMSKFGSSDKIGTSSNPTAVKGTGTNGTVDVDMADDDLKYLRDIAERDYINKFSTATLAPKVSIKFGNVTKDADADKITERIKKILQEEIAVAAEGAYS